MFGPRHNVYLHQGRFPKTITSELNEARFCFVHFDGAFYETTRDAISFFFPRLVPGGVLLFDDWEWAACPGVKRALPEGRQETNYDICLENAHQVYVRKGCCL